MEKSIYDEVLKTRLKHLVLHPNYLPHIGKNYELARAKTFIIAESHYLPEIYNNKFTAEDWYLKPKSIYEAINYDKGWFNTRGVISEYQKSTWCSIASSTYLN